MRSLLPGADSLKAHIAPVDRFKKELVQTLATLLTPGKFSPSTHHAREGLSAKTAALKNAMNSMNAAQYVESNLPSTSKNLFFQNWPGWRWGHYNPRKLYAEHRYLTLGRTS